MKLSKMMSVPAVPLPVLFLASCAERIPQPPAPIILLPLSLCSKHVRNQRCMVKHGATLAVMHWHCKWLYQPVLAVATLNQWRMEVIKAKNEFL